MNTAHSLSRNISDVCVSLLQSNGTESLSWYNPAKTFLLCIALYAEPNQYSIYKERYHPSPTTRHGTDLVTQHEFVPTRIFRTHTTQITSGPIIRPLQSYIICNTTNSSAYHAAAIPSQVFHTSLRQIQTQKPYPRQAQQSPLDSISSTSSQTLHTPSRHSPKFSLYTSAFHP